MVQVFSADLWGRGFTLLAQAAQVASTSPPKEPVSKAWTEKFVMDVLSPMELVCHPHQLVESMGMIQRIGRDLESPVTSAEIQWKFDTLMQLMESEAGKRLFVSIPVSRQIYYTGEDGKSATIFGPSAEKAFASALPDMIEAGNCYALGRATACVFHAMRVLEPGLRAMAKDVGETFDVQQWHTIIELIESKIRKESASLPTGAQKSDRLQFLSEAAKEFYYFKDGWRNHVAHAKASYDLPQSLSVLTHVQIFMQHLSKRLSE